MPELTLFPDGEGYMEHAWNDLNALQRAALIAANDNDDTVRARPVTLDVLSRRGLLTPTRDITDRGRALVAWVRSFDEDDTDA